MGAITMPSASFVKTLAHDYPQFVFQNASVSRWSPASSTVYYSDDMSPEGKLILLHELGHALAGHTSYTKDIELLACERQAWQQACALAGAYGVPIVHETIETHMDSYREWLHSRSRCPSCLSAGIQTRDLDYRCVLCMTSWTANDARQCGLKRYTKNTTV